MYEIYCEPDKYSFECLKFVGEISLASGKPLVVHSDCEPHKFMKLFGKHILAAHISQQK